MTTTSDLDGDLLSIGQLAKRTGVTVSALRYYDELGIVSPVTRVSGQRRFSETAVPQVGFVRTAQRAGFSLDEITQLLSGTTCSSASLITEKVFELRQQQEEIEAMVRLLEEFVRCGCKAISECGIPSVQNPADHF